MESTENYRQFAHDADTLLLQANIAKEAASVLRKKQTKIDKKRRQTKSKNLPKCVEEYNSSFMDIREAVNRMQDILCDGGLNETKAEFSRPFNAHQRERNKARLKQIGKAYDVLHQKYQDERDQRTKYQRLYKEEQEGKEDVLRSLKQKGQEYDELHTKYQDERDERRNYQRLYKEEQEGKEDAFRSLKKKSQEYDELHTKYKDERDQRTKYQSLYKEEQEDALGRLSSIASSNLRDDNPNIADLSDEFRPTKIAEKMSDLYDNQWTEAYSVFEEKGLGEKEIIESLLDMFMFMAAYTECIKLASDNFFESVQRCIEIPPEGCQLPANYKVVMPDQLKQQVKKFRKTRARHVVKEVEMIVMKRIKSENKDLDAIYVYLLHCIEIAWFCAVQDPPIVVRRDAPVNFDTNAYKEYTRRGKYTEFVVLPAMYLHDEGALLLKGVAQGFDKQASDSKAAAESREKSSGRNQHESLSSDNHSTDVKLQHVTTIQAQMLDSKGDGAVHHRENEARNNMEPGTRQQQHNARTTFYTNNMLNSREISSAGMSSSASGKLRDNNPNIADLSDEFRPTKIAEKMSELYDNQWTEAYSVLEDKGSGEKQIITSLLDMFMASYTECSQLASENFFESVQRCIEIPTEGFQLPANYKVVMPDQLKQQVKEFRKTQARHVVKEIETIVMNRIKSKLQDSDVVSVYLSHCIETAWFCAVQDPPLVVRRYAPVKFDSNSFKEYTRRGKYAEFVVWPALYLYDGGALLSKGAAQGSDTTPPDNEASTTSGGVSSAGYQPKAPHSSISASANISKARHTTEIQARKTDHNGDRTDTQAFGSEASTSSREISSVGMSSNTSGKLRDNNPNITEFSDEFRQTKIAEIMSELYDNQWTEAYNVLKEQVLGEKQIITSLLDMFMVKYTSSHLNK